MTDLVLEQWSIDRLRPFARNPRIHDPEQVARIAGSMTEFGWLVPILADSQGNVIAGHGRLLAARQLGLTEVPVVLVAATYLPSWGLVCCTLYMINHLLFNFFPKLFDKASIIFEQR